MPPKVQQDEIVKLIQQHQALLHKVCHVYCDQEQDREDLFQEIVIQIWKAYPGFRGDSKFTTWIYRIALNTAISGVRKAQRAVPIVYPELAPANIQDEQADKEKEQLIQFLYKAIEQLGAIGKAIVMLYLDDKSYEEMEEIMGINQNNLRVKMNRIKEKLRKLTQEVAYES